MIKRWVLTLSLSLLATIVHSEPSLLRQKAAKQFINQLVRNDHFDRRQLQMILASALYQPKIIESMQRPYEKKDWDVYRALFLTPERLEKGVAFWRRNQAALAKVQKDTGVPAEMIVAILGVETLYGERQGNYRVLDALSTLAFYYPARAEYFKRELREFLLLSREQHRSPTSYKGSYAGAIGAPQFMPSSYRHFAQGYRVASKADLMSSDRDAIRSVANYFQQHGWLNKQSVAEKAIVAHPQTLTLNAHSATYPFLKLLKAGVKPEHSSRTHPQQAGILALTTEQGFEYWLAYPNFYVITRYNTSPQYALVVHLLSQSLRQHYASTLG